MATLQNNVARMCTDEPLRGWLFDVYPTCPGKMAVWILTEGGARVRLTDEYEPKFYVSGRMADLSTLAAQFPSNSSITRWRYVTKNADFMTLQPSRVLEVTTADYRTLPSLARRLQAREGYRKFTLHNVDIPPVQAYLYERHVFPLAFVTITIQNGQLVYRLLDSVKRVDYQAPPLYLASLRVNISASGVVPCLSDPIHRIVLEADGARTTIAEGDERDRILRLVQWIKTQDPDVIVSRGGDSFLFQYLAHRAFVNRVLPEFVLGRDPILLYPSKKRGVTFFSYGRVYFKAPMRRLYGRIHIDERNTFLYTTCGLDGLIEAARTCRVPLHKVARASIGTIMSSLQLYQATKDDILVPWKKNEPEAFKSARELLAADRGGFIFEPKLGIHDEVVEIDFASMYPTLMATRNISADTVRCKCCPDSKVTVPELNYNICERRKGIVPRTLQLLLEKRARYTQLKRTAETPRSQALYDRRQRALKWILVTCFGYLGYKNARFGKVDAHIAVCAFARDVLLRTACMAEEGGFDVIHGIVDSLWLKKPGASPSEYVTFCKAVSKKIGVQLKVEGRYCWIIFLPSRVRANVPVLNRYYGVFESGRLKLKGIEAVRHDTPPFIRKAQTDMIRVLAKAPNTKAFMKRIPAAIKVLRDYVETLQRRSVKLRDLIVTKQLSYPPTRYIHNVFHAIAAQQLVKAGIAVSSGQRIRYVITDATNRRPDNRVKAVELINAATQFDADKYLTMLILAATTILSPFGFPPKYVRKFVCAPFQLTYSS